MAKPSTFVEGMAQNLLLDIKLSVQSTSSSLCPKGHWGDARPIAGGELCVSKSSHSHNLSGYGQAKSKVSHISKRLVWHTRHGSFVMCANPPGREVDA